MSYNTENTMEKRLARVSAAVDLREGDRVPFSPKVGMAYIHTADTQMYEAYMDLRNIIPDVKNFLSKYEMDLFWVPALYPTPAMEILRTNSVRWPGATYNLPLNTGHQIVDDEYMLEEEYDEFLRNPSDFFMRKVFPRKHARLQGLSKIHAFKNVVELAHYANMAAFADPEVRDALHALMYAGEAVVKWQQATGALCEAAVEMQSPPGVVMGQNAPYDMLADNLRGYIELPMDIANVPDKVLAAIDVMTDIAMEGIAGIKAAGMQYVFMPMHGGTDSMMSNETYRKFYWPSLQKLIEEIIRLDMTPYIFFEGQYNTRLEIIREVPAKKCIYMFEQVDIARAKKVLGDTVCIAGNLPTTSLIVGDKQDVIDETKRLIDICAPGGGFIMDCSIVLDHYKEENLDAWYETTMTYGKY